MDTLDIKGHIVTIDAIGCQKDITAKISSEEGDYVLQVKGNQKSTGVKLLEYIKSFFNNENGVKFFKYSDKNKEIVEECSVFVQQQIDNLKKMPYKETIQSW